jgi:hypothetical protein
LGFHKLFDVFVFGIGLARACRIQGGIDAWNKPAARWRIDANPLVYV